MINYISKIRIFVCFTLFVYLQVFSAYGQDAFKWRTLYPSPELLVKQPGDEQFNHFVSLVKSTDNKTILGYLP
ncbi:MAG: hypothetical protein K0B05_10610 [Bacteroidales bacterium]|nr:hypothetical protein [Bacteroidales bacterium]